MKKHITYRLLGFLLLFILSLNAGAQTARSGKSKRAESNIKSEQRRERQRIDANEKKAAKAEKRLQKKAKYGNRKKAKNRERKSRLKN